MGIADIFNGIGNKITGFANGAVDIFKDFGKNAASIADKVITTVGNVGEKIIDKGSEIINTGVNTIGNFVNKGIDTVGNIGSTISFIPIAIIGVGGLLIFSLISNAKPVSEGVATVAQSVAPYVALAAK